jgi:Flp pilus assembly protein TadB
VPLSEDEQRILQEIEQQFYEHDPALAGEIGSTTLYKHAGRNLKWSAFCFVAGLALLIATFATSLLVGFLGFLIMLVCAFLFERNLRKLGRAGWQQVTESMRGGNLREYFGDAGNRLRRRFKREE